MYIGCIVKRQRVQRDGGAIDGTIAPNASAWLRAWVQNNFGHALLLPFREENIKSLGAAVPGLCSTHFFPADSTLTHMTIQVTQL